MIVRMILWLCVIWVPAMEYIFMAQRDKVQEKHYYRRDPAP